MDDELIKLPEINKAISLISQIFQTKHTFNIIPIIRPCQSFLTINFHMKILKEFNYYYWYHDFTKKN